MSMTVEALEAEIYRILFTTNPSDSGSLARQLHGFIERHIAAGPADWVASEVLALASERDKGYANREHGDVLNGRIADKVVPLPEVAATVCLTPDGYAHGHMLDLQVQVKPMETFAIGDRLCRYDDAIRYGDAREAAGRADAVPALDVLMGERGLPTVADALGHSRNFAAANPALSQTTRDHIEGLCNMLEIAAHHPAPEGLKEWSIRMAEKEIETGCDITAGVPDSYEPDDIAVDRFAAAMKEKMEAARAKGRGGWDGPTCNAQLLSDMLRDHVAKGDPRDVANFCMMLWNRGEAIQLPAPAPPQQMTTQGEDTARLDWLVESWGNDLGPLHRAVAEAFRKSDASAARDAIDAARATGSQP